MIQNYFGNGQKFGVNIEYIVEDIPLGTAGSLSMLDSTLGATLIVTNGDVLTDFSYRDLITFHQNNNAEITVATKTIKWQNPFGVIKTQGLNIIGYEEKPIIQSQINLGVYHLKSPLQ